MPQFRAKLSDGRIVTVEADQAPTEDEILAAVGSGPVAAQEPIPQSTLRLAPTFGEKLGRAYDVFQIRMRENGILAPLKVPEAMGEAAMQFDTVRAGRELLSPLIGPTEDERLNRPVRQGVMDESGLIPGAVQNLGRIEPVAELAASLKSVPSNDDSTVRATAKALQNVALDVGTTALSPLGVGAMISPRAAAAGFAPVVLESVRNAIKTVSSDVTEQEKIETGLMAILGLTGTVGAALGAPGAAKPRTSVPGAEIASEAVQGARGLAQNLGMETPLTAAQATGSKGIARQEAFMRRLGSGISSRPVAIEAQQLAVDEAVRRAINERDITPKAEVGRAVAGEITEGEQSLRGETAGAVSGALQKTTGAAEAGLRTATASSEELTALGQRIRDATQFTHESNRQVANRMAEDAEASRVSAGGGKNVPFVDLSNAQTTAQGIINSTLKKQTESGREVIPDFLPGFKKIQELANLNTPQTFTEAQRLRSLIGESIGKQTRGAADEFGGGFSLGDLKQIYRDISKDMETSLQGLSPEARTKYLEFNKFYRENIEKFEQNPFIAKVMNQASDKGISNTAEIVQHFSSGEGKLQDLQSIKGFLTAPDYASLRRGIVDAMTGRETIPTARGEVVDLSKLSERWKGLAPEFKRELIGDEAKSKAFGDILNEFGFAKKTSETIGGLKAATPDQLAQLLDDFSKVDPKVARNNFADAITTESRRRRNYYNDITAKIRAGNLGRVEVNPEQFVDEFVFASDDANTVMTALRQLTPETRAQVQDQAARRLFQQAASVELSTIEQLAKGEPVVSSEKLVNVLVRDPKRRAVVDLLLPADKKELITNYLKYRRGIDAAYKAGGGQGLVSGQMMFGGGGMNRGVMSIIPALGESFVKLRLWRWVANAYFSKAGQEVMKQVVQDQRFLPVAIAASAKAKIASEIGIKPGSTLDLSRRSILELSSVFGASAVEDYLERKRKIDSLIAELPEEQQQALIADSPEVATPVQVQP